MKVFLGVFVVTVAAVPLSWQEAQKKADAMLPQMSQVQKYKLMRGVGWQMYDLQPGYYVGTTEDIPELGIPSQKFFDSSGGFRTIFPELVGTVTCFPSMLALAATWDPVLVESFGGALAAEFKGKGANGILGPGVNVARVARNGRNWEYISGEDPYLGSQLAGAYVRGAQNAGVMTVVKHLALNQEEGLRDSGSSVVDDKTAWELYYPPFQAAVDAGTTAAMCSYNLEDGVYSCSNPKTLQAMKKGMGFNGFVQSDWWATHETSVTAGLDQMQPSPLQEDNTSYRGVGWFDDDHLNNVSSKDIDASVRRILSSMYKVDVFDGNRCVPPDCKDELMKVVTNEHHAQVARQAAAESIVLLRNENEVLPISSAVKTIAVVGSAAVARAFNPVDPNQGSEDWSRGDYYSGGGSGHVTAGYVVSALDGISKRASQMGIKILNSSTDNIQEAEAAAEQADLVIVVAGTTTGESKDRENLRLDNNADSLIEAVSAKGRKVVVLTQICGAIVMPWRESVSSILSLFLGGQETGTAWADVLFGDMAPIGHLPLMMPESERDQFSPSAEFAENTPISYTEGLATSYRNPYFKSAYPFGHGLTYTTFEYGVFHARVCGDDVCVIGDISNTGRIAAKTIPQLYLEFPVEAGFPAPILKNFQKTELIQPGASAKVTFRLMDRDLSFFDGLDDGVPRWTLVTKAVALVGASSGDIRSNLTVHSRGPNGAFCVDRPGCASLKPLDGLCCPVQDGTSLACCDESTAFIV